MNRVLHVGRARTPRRPGAVVKTIALAWALVAVIGPSTLLADGPAPTGQWVRVTTGPLVVGEGFAMGPEPAQGKRLAHDRRTTTFDVNGRAVRVPRPGTRLEGVVKAEDDDTLTLADAVEGVPIVIPRSAIQRLDVRRRASRTGVGVLMGALLGAGIGYATSGRGCENDDFGLCGIAKAERAVVGLAAGAVVGGIVAPGARWTEDVPLGHPRARIQPAHGGVALAMSVEF